MNVSAGQAPNRLYRNVADQIVAMIKDGTFSATGKLPPERDLADSLGVSRPTIREAMIALEILNIVEIRDRSGIYVVQGQAREGKLSEGMDLPTDDLSVGAFELVEARILIEGDAAGLAAEAASADDVDTLNDYVLHMESTDPDVCETADRNFHIHIASMTHNGALIAAIELLWDLRKKSPLATQIMSRARGGGLGARILEHKNIISALKARNPSAARQAMREHLEGVREYLLDATETAEIEALKRQLKQKRQTVLSRTKIIVP
ncbi:FadR/GntR family transcriptional regulator [Asticcacaulis benevestitus]|uniref:HTH gntR-type domain-containing protein n=1 Tax=Asticcacaulis benevestitus DSM 16100 = ATCC BAA-896 TaxID=1121022 RepID=V4RNQ7_9CAUL|nr:hypothetical protein ABENE_07175 [Asticcacaulis benevestitus DSM 16100 = ATCC BAA-896]